MHYTCTVYICMSIGLCTVHIIVSCTLLVAHEVPVSIHDQRNRNPGCDHSVWKMAHFERFARGSPLYGEGGGDPRERALRSIFSKLLHCSSIYCVHVHDL